MVPTIFTNHYSNLSPDSLNHYLKWLIIFLDISKTSSSFKCEIFEGSHMTLVVKFSIVCEIGFESISVKNSIGNKYAISSDESRIVFSYSSVLVYFVWFNEDISPDNRHRRAFGGLDYLLIYICTFAGK